MSQDLSFTLELRLREAIQAFISFERAEASEAMRAKCEAIARDTITKNVNTCIETATAISDAIAALKAKADD